MVDLYELNPSSLLASFPQALASVTSVRSLYGNSHKSREVRPHAGLQLDDAGLPRDAAYTLKMQISTLN